jgi:hypothetical protein
MSEALSVVSTEAYDLAPARGSSPDGPLVATLRPSGRA